MKYYAKVKLIGEDGEVIKVKGDMVSVSFVNDEIEKSDGVRRWRELTGMQTVTIVIERELEVMK